MTDEFQPDDYREYQQEFLYELIGFRDDGVRTDMDSYVHDHFYEVMYNDELSYQERLDLYQELIEYLAEAYEIDFDDLWDWEDFRDWYASA